jgi:hypothetical protein
VTIPRTLLHALVRERGWTYAQFRAAYEETAQTLGWNVTVEEQTFRRWTSGRVAGTPNRPAPQVLETLFGCSAETLLQTPAAPRTTSRPAPGPGSALTNKDLMMTAHDAASHAGDAASQTVPDITLDQLDDDVVALAQAYGRTPPAAGFARARALLKVAQALLDRTQIPRQRTRAYLAAGQAAALLSAAAFDLGSLPTAVQLARTTALYGQVIEHGPLQAYAHGSLALMAYWGGRPTDAVRLIHTAQSFAGLGDTARTRLDVIDARAHAHAGTPGLAHTAIERIATRTGGARDDLHDGVGGEFGFPPERVAMSNATTLLLLRDAPGAEAAAEHALALATDPQAGPRVPVATQAAIDLARARLMRGELDGAAEALEPAFGVPAEWRIAGALERMAGVRTELSRAQYAGVRTARDLEERIEYFSATAGAHPLGAGTPLVIET